MKGVDVIVHGRTVQLEIFNFVFYWLLEICTDRIEVFMETEQMLIFTRCLIATNIVLELESLIRSGKDLPRNQLE